MQIEEKFTNFISLPENKNYKWKPKTGDFYEKLNTIKLDEKEEITGFAVIESVTTSKRWSALFTTNKSKVYFINYKNETKTANFRDIVSVDVDYNFAQFIKITLKNEQEIILEIDKERETKSLFSTNHDLLVKLVDNFDLKLQANDHDLDYYLDAKKDNDVNNLIKTLSVMAFVFCFTTIVFFTQITIAWLVTLAIMIINALVVVVGVYNQNKSKALLFGLISFITAGAFSLFYAYKRTKNAPKDIILTFSN